MPFVPIILPMHSGGLGICLEGWSATVANYVIGIGACICILLLISCLIMVAKEIMR